MCSYHHLTRMLLCNLQLLLICFISELSYMQVLHLHSAVKVCTVPFSSARMHRQPLEDLSLACNAVVILAADCRAQAGITWQQSELQWPGPPIACTLDLHRSPKAAQMLCAQERLARLCLRRHMALPSC